MQETDQIQSNIKEDSLEENRIVVDSLPEGMTDVELQSKWIDIQNALDQRFGEQASPKLKSIARSDIQKNPENINSLFEAIQNVPEANKSYEDANEIISPSKVMPGGPPEQITAELMELRMKNAKLLSPKEKILDWIGFREIDSDADSLIRVIKDTEAQKAKLENIKLGVKDLVGSKITKMAFRKNRQDSLPIIRPSNRKPELPKTSQIEPEIKEADKKITQADKESPIVNENNNIYINF